MDTNPRTWLDRLVGIAITLVVIALLLHWAWDLLRPLMPIILAAVVVGIIVMVIVRYQRNHYW